MTDDRDLDRGDRALVEAIRAEFQPATTSPARAAELRRELAARIDTHARPRRWSLAIPALAVPALAALLWFALPAHMPVDTRDANAELDAFVDPDAFASELTDGDDYLPADYQLLALVVDDAPAEQ